MKLKVIYMYVFVVSCSDYIAMESDEYQFKINTRLEIWDIERKI
jgi:hypothetical protein